MTEDEISDVTIKHVLVDADYNDLGFSVENRLILESKEQEVVDIMMTLFDDEQIMRAYAKDIEDNKEKQQKE